MSPVHATLASRRRPMFDDLELLRNNPYLRDLLSHNSQLGQANREAWQDRLMQLEGVEPRDLVSLHGMLIAFGWIEQNTGQAPGGQDGTEPACYRITSSGEGALRQVQDVKGEDKASPVVETHKAVPPKFVRKRREKIARAEAPAS